MNGSLIAVLTIALLVVPAFAQNPMSLPDAAKQARIEELHKLGSSAGAGEWRKLPVSAANQIDMVATGVRAERNKYWSTHLPSPDGNLSPPTWFALAPEIPAGQNLLYVVGTFKNYRVLEPSPGRGAYTEISFQVSNVLKDDAGVGVSAPSLIDIGETGGSVLGTDGKTHAYNLHLDRFPFQPGHTYLLILSYEKQGDFYLPLRKWDLTSGTALPAGDLEAGKYIDGHAEVGGKSMEDAIDFIKTHAVNGR